MENKTSKGPSADEGCASKYKKETHTFSKNSTKSTEDPRTQLLKQVQEDDENEERTRTQLNVLDVTALYSTNPDDSEEPPTRRVSQTDEVPEASNALSAPSHSRSAWANRLSQNCYTEMIDISQQIENINNRITDTMPKFLATVRKICVWVPSLRSAWENRAQIVSNMLSKSMEARDVLSEMTSDEFINISDLENRRQRIIELCGASMDTCCDIYGHFMKLFQVLPQYVSMFDGSEIVQLEADISQCQECLLGILNDLHKITFRLQDLNIEFDDVLRINVLNNGRRVSSSAAQRELIVDGRYIFHSRYLHMCMGYLMYTVILLMIPVAVYGVFKLFGKHHKYS